MMILDNPTVTRTLFHPRSELEYPSPAGSATLTASDDVQIAGYFHAGEASDTLLILFHGNGEIAADYAPLVPLYTDCGVSCWMIDYRGYGRSTGTPSFSAMFRDAEAILADVPRVGAWHGGKFSHVIVMGRSLGSASAIHLAATCPSALSGLVLDSPYADGLALIARLGGPTIRRKDVPDLEDNIAMIQRCRLPTLIIHGTNDQIIPFAEAEALFQACPSQAKRLVKVAGAGHNNLLLVGFSEYRRELRNFVAQVRSSGADRGTGHSPELSLR